MSLLFIYVGDILGFEFFISLNTALYATVSKLLAGVNITAPQQRYPFTFAFEADEAKADKSL